MGSLLDEVENLLRKRLICERPGGGLCVGHVAFGRLEAAAYFGSPFRGFTAVEKGGALKCPLRKNESRMSVRATKFWRSLRSINTEVRQDLCVNAKPLAAFLTSTSQSHHRHHTDHR